MHRTWLIAHHHFLLEARKRSFWILLFSLPLFLAFIVGFAILAESFFDGSTTLGYVDPAGFLADTALDDENVQLQRFDNAAAAQAALDAEEIAAYYVLADDFAAGREAELVFYTSPPGSAQVAFTDMVRRNHLAGTSTAVTERVLADTAVTVRSLDTGREFGTNPTATDFLPLFVALMFGFLAMTTSGYMMEVLVAEKENRTMEIIISSISAGKLMTGKILGALGIAALQLLVWIGCLLLALLVGRLAGVNWLTDVQPRWRDIVQMVLISVPVYFFLTALFTTIGSTFVESNDAQQIGPFIFLLILLPIYIFPLMINEPHGPAALFFSFFPPTAITTFALRLLVTMIPWWQVGVAVIIAIIFAVVMTWLAAKAFRLGMLRYGQRLRLSELFGRKRPADIPVSGNV
jgi:ABC-2 type transport system permease protein